MEVIQKNDHGVMRILYGIAKELGVDNQWLLNYIENIGS